MANDAWEALFRAQATVHRELLAADVWDDCSPNEYGVLYALSKAPDGLRISELGNDALLTQAGLSRLVARLVGTGLVERVADRSTGHRAPRRSGGRPRGRSGGWPLPGHPGRPVGTGRRPSPPVTGPSVTGPSVTGWSVTGWSVKGSQEAGVTGGRAR